MLHDRPTYVAKLDAAKDNGFIKVITGMRRCGKSSLLALFAQHLKEAGVPPENIILINFESYEFESVRTYQDLHDLVASRLPEEGHAYLLLDEVQYVEGWERAVNALRVDEDVDIYLTGSNATLLSSQLATLLSGRSIQIDVHPLSFAEFLDFTSNEADEAAFERYMRFGGLPPVVEQDSADLASTVLSGIYDTVYVRDIAQHTQVRNQQVFDDIARYLADTAGSPISITNIENRLKSARRTTSGDTIERYIRALLDAYLFRRVDRLDIKGGRRLQGLSKYYPTDTGIRTMLCGFLPGDYGLLLENVVYNELVARGYTVHVGKSDGLEIDFVATGTGASLREESCYIQVKASLLDTKTRERELRSLARLPDSAGKRVVVTLDRMGLGEAPEAPGVDIVNALDWLTGKAE